MKLLIRSLLLIAALMLGVSAYAGTNIALDAPVDCTHYVGGGGTAVSIDLLSIDYETGEARFRLINASGVALGNSAVFGVRLTLPAAESAVKAAVLAAIAAAAPTP
ncbi:hypothetical protein [Opitutus sp. ER46]|uniref:hypothetical protein n=1 Tax=Opitutus sp. ER46 TaxID=2161864 RepID=UPI000D3008D9|nr:hypothetical protein [Opitutus sp. ER46]PTX95771.1 hypothetical protein DB354_10190 [Opitutus sp. ER46]